MPFVTLCYHQDQQGAPVARKEIRRKPGQIGPFVIGEFVTFHRLDNHTNSLWYIRLPVAQTRKDAAIPTIANLPAALEIPVTLIVYLRIFEGATNAFVHIPTHFATACVAPSNT